jgi:hypothetical protein
LAEVLLPSFGLDDSLWIAYALSGAGGYWIFTLINEYFSGLMNDATLRGKKFLRYTARGIQQLVISLVVTPLVAIVVYSISSSYHSPDWLTYTLTGLSALMAYGGTTLGYAPKKDELRRGRTITKPDSAQKEATRYQNNGGGIFFGGVMLPEEARLTHFAFIGASRRGKTLSIRLLMQSPGVLPAICNHKDHRAVIFDPKRDFYPL